MPTRCEADRRADPAGVARSLANVAYAHIGAAHLPDGETGPEFVRRNLDALGIGKELQTVRYGNRTLILPEASQPGAAPMLQPKGNGRLQNTRAAKAERLEAAARKRAEREATRAEQIATTGKLRKTRSDKGLKRGPNKLTKEKPAAGVR